MMIVGNNKIPTLSSVINGENLGTLFLPSGNVPRRKNWLSYCANVSGKVVVDDGAKKALLDRKSLLSCGVKEYQGTFSSGSVVEICGLDGKVIGKGVIAFSSDTLKEINGESEHAQMVIHADNIAIIKE